jgi:HlyD family type I secretion membrane fusion protein
MADGSTPPGRSTRGVHELALLTVGAVVQAAQPLKKVVPADAVLEVEAKVVNRDIGFVVPGQEVQVKLDAFTFTRYGALPGRVAAISSDVVADETLGPVYRVRVALDRQAMEVDGRMVPLAPGMTATVDIRTGKRRLIDYLLAPVQRYRARAWGSGEYAVAIRHATFPFGGQAVWIKSWN